MARHVTCDIVYQYNCYIPKSCDYAFPVRLDSLRWYNEDSDYSGCSSSDYCLFNIQCTWDHLCSSLSRVQHYTQKEKVFIYVACIVVRQKSLHPLSMHAG